jgi:hypothetical protein
MLTIKLERLRSSPILAASCAYSLVTFGTYTVIGTDHVKWGIVFWALFLPILMALVGPVFFLTFGVRSSTKIRTIGLSVGLTLLCLIPMSLFALAGFNLGRYFAVWRAERFIERAHAFAERFYEEHNRYPDGDEYEGFEEFRDQKLPRIVIYKGYDGSCCYGNGRVTPPPIPFEIHPKPIFPFS